MLSTMQALAISIGNANEVLGTHSEGLPQDYAEAVKWWRLAAEQGLASAQTNLGAAYVRGEGVRQDYAEAVK
jgi:TPR repeat protein